MRFPVFLMLAGMTPAMAAEGGTPTPPPPTCAQLRAAIAERTGNPGTIDRQLLTQLSQRTDCAFTQAEFQRAAWGDRPAIPRSSTRAWRHHRHNDDD
jgi:hypothetical protein